MATRWRIPPRTGALLLVLLAVVLTASYARRPGDFAGYLLVGETLLHGADPYRDVPPGISTWPPFFWSLAVPLALLARISLIGARVVWLVGNWVALYVVLDLGTRLVWGKRLTLTGDGADGRVPLATATVLVPLLLTARYTLANFEHLQINVLLYALTLGGLLLLARGRAALGGLLVGAAAALKVMPVLFVPYFVWRRQWRAAAWTAGWTAVLSLSPALVFGWSGFAAHVAAWRGALAEGWMVGKMNQSVYAMFDRVLGHGLLPLATAGVNDVPPSREPAALVALVLSLAVVTALGMWTCRGPVAAGAPDRRALAEWSIVLLVASLFGTVTWKAYLVVLLLPNALLFAVWRDPATDAAVRRRVRAFALTAFGLGLITADVVVGRALGWRFEMASFITLACLVLLGTLFWYRRRLELSPR